MIESEGILDNKEQPSLIRTSSVVLVEQITLVLLIVVLILEGLICWFSWDYFVVLVLSISFSIGAVQYVWQWKRASQLQDQSLLKVEKLELPKIVRLQKWSIVALIVLKSAVVFFFARIFYFGIQSGISLSIFPIWQLLLPTANLLLTICLVFYLIMTRQAIKTKNERGITR